MRIPINKDISKYKQDLMKGLNLRQAITLVLLFLINIGGSLFLVMVLNIPPIAVIYLMLPIDACIGIIGFYDTKETGTGMFSYFKNLIDVKFSETKIYESQEFEKEMDIRYMTNEKDQVSKKSKKKKRRI